MTDANEIEVRSSVESDGEWAAPAAQLIRDAAQGNDIAVRDIGFLRSKIVGGRAALAFLGGELIGFGYWSDWEGGRFVSHSGLVVRPDCHGQGLGRKLKLAMFASSRERFPEAHLMSLTTSPAVKKLNESLGFRYVSLDQLTRDESFWEGCKTCRNYAEVQARGERCCCEGMLLRAEDLQGDTQG